MLRAYTVAMWHMRRQEMRYTLLPLVVVLFGFQLKVFMDGRQLQSLQRPLLSLCCTFSQMV